MKSRAVSFACLALFGLAMAGRASADPDRTLALAGDGTVYLAHPGMYGDLFPQGTAAPPQTAVLALDVTHPDGSFDRFLVPGTQGAEVEDTPIVLLQEPSRSVYLAWTSRQDGGSTLVLRSFTDGQWSAATALDEDPSAAKAALRVAVTRDAYTSVDDQGNSRTVQRTVLQFLWWQAEGMQPEGTFHRSVLFVDGALVGADDLVALGGLDTAAPEPTTPQVAHALVQSPMLGGGRNDRSALAATVNPRTGRLFSIELSVVPGELSSLADDTRSFTVATATQNGTDDLQLIASAVRMHIIGGGRRFPDGTLLAIAEGVRMHIIGGGRAFGGDAVALANDLRKYMLRTGTNLLENGIDNPGLDDTTTIFELPVDDQGATHQVRLRVMSVHPAPATAETTQQIFSSGDGSRLLVAWDGTNRLNYTEWTADGWSSPAGVTLGALSHDAASLALQRRVRDQ
jgi:hypothetical protein